MGLYYWLPDNQRVPKKQVCEQVMEKYKISKLVVVGDFNFPNIDWDSLSARAGKRGGVDLLGAKGYLGKRVGPLRNKGGNVCTKPDEVGEVLNKYFASAFTKDMLDGESREGYVDILGH
eukprot:g45063.t1